MSTRCQHRNPDNGEYCKNWAMKGGQFCNNHLPSKVPPLPPLPSYGGMSEDQILASLKAERAHLVEPPANHDEVMTLVGRAMADALNGRIASAQAYAVGYLGDVWLRASEKRYKANKTAKAERESEERWKVWGPIFEKATSKLRPALLKEFSHAPSPAPSPEPGTPSPAAACENGNRTANSDVLPVSP